MVVPPPPPLDRKVVSLQINPQNGCVVALCNDGSMWIHSGSEAAHDQPWKRIKDVPPTNPEPEEPEDAITTLV